MDGDKSKNAKKYIGIMNRRQTQSSLFPGYFSVEQLTFQPKKEEKKKNARQMLDQIEDFVEAHLCKLCVTLPIARATVRGVGAHACPQRRVQLVGDSH